MVSFCLVNLIQKSTLYEEYYTLLLVDEINKFYTVLSLMRLKSPVGVLRKYRDYKKILFPKHIHISQLLIFIAF